MEFKSACISTTLALESISYWVAAQPEDKVGVVIASDRAKYPLRSSGEYTQGAGSVSLLVKKNPRLIALEQIYGSFTRNENDFFRPLGNRTAVVNGKHSNLCYLDAMEGAFDAFARRKDIETDIGKEPNSHNCEDREKRLALDAEFARREIMRRSLRKRMLSPGLLRNSAAGSACCAFHEYLGKAGKEKADITR